MSSLSAMVACEWNSNCWLKDCAAVSTAASLLDFDLFETSLLQTRIFNLSNVFGSVFIKQINVCAVHISEFPLGLIYLLLRSWKINYVISLLRRSRVKLVTWEHKKCAHKLWRLCIFHFFRRCSKADDEVNICICRYEMSERKRERAEKTTTNIYLNKTIAFHHSPNKHS